jgi:mono/diheme cytochrome c family protein
MSLSESKERAALLLIAILLTGCRAKVPGKTESAAVNWTKRHLTVGGKNDKNPVPAIPENIADGKQIFTSYCMVCHGLDGQNTGVPFAETMSPAVPSLASSQVQAYTDGQLKWIIENGIYPSGMPPSKGVFSDDDMWRMVLYIRHLPKQGSLGEPAIYGGSSK